MSIASFSIKRPIFITSLVILSVLTGVVSLTRLGVEMFPSVNIPVVAITVPYPGAGPEEIENLISRPLEEQISSISGLKRLTSRNNEGFAVITAEFYLETDVKWAEQEVRTKVSRARRNLPEGIDEPVIVRFDPSEQSIVRLAIFADLPPAELYDLANENIKPSLEQVNNVGSVAIIGGTKREIQIELDRNKLNSTTIPAVMIAKQLENYGSNVPVGKFETNNKEVSFRSIGQFESLRQIENAVVSFSGDLGNALLLKELGTIRDGTEDKKNIATLWAPTADPSEPVDKSFKLFAKKEKEKIIRTTRTALFFDVYKQSDTNTIAVTDGVLKKMKLLNEQMKSKKGNPQIMLIRDGSRPIRMNIKDVSESIILGIILAVLVVYLFLGNVRSTVITGLAIPNSILGAFVIMGIMGFSINIMTLLALSLSVGLLVDDAIVVRENIFRKLEAGMKAFKAAEVGTNEVLLAVVATSLTVMAVFFPIGFLSGMVGQFFKQFGLTVVFAMLVSMFDALAVAPLLSAYFAGHVNEKQNFVIKAFGKFQDGLDDVYSSIVKFAIAKPLVIILIMFGVFAASIWSTRFVKNTFMPPNDMGEFMVTIQMPPGTSLEGTYEVADKIQEKLKVVTEMNLIATVAGNAEGEPNVANLAVALIPYEERKRSTSEVKEEVRKLLREFDYARPNVLDYSAVGGVQYPFTLYLKGDDLAKIGDYSSKLVKKLKEIPDLVEIDSDYREGKPEFQVKLNSDRMQAVGVMPSVAGGELRYHVAGNVVGQYHEKGLEYDIRMRLKPEQRNLRLAYNETKVPNMQMPIRLIPLKAISNGGMTTGPEKITRQDRTRVVLIHANLAPGGAIGNATERAKQIMDKELLLPEGVDYKFVGQAEDMKELVANILLAFGLALVFIYLVLASLYESFITPVTILFAIPPAISGAFFGLALTGEMMNIFSMIGIIMLMGLVTKNSILLVDYAVEGLKSGMTRADAIYHAGRVRLRPILMTTLAMIAGTLPLALGIGEVAKMRRSMGIAIIGGLLVSTLITLIVVPAIFSYIDRFREFVESKFRRTEEEREGFDTSDVYTPFDEDRSGNDYIEASDQSINLPVKSNKRKKKIEF